MKCDKHPEMDAVGTCVYCGRGVCEDCKVRMFDKIHCKECVEAGRVRGNAPPPQLYQTAPVYYYQLPPLVRLPPRPKGPPRPLLVRVGALGALISALCLFVMVIGVIESTLLVPLVSAFCVGLFIMAIGCYGIYWNFGCFWGGFGAVALPVMGVLQLLFLRSLGTIYFSGYIMWISALVISMVFVHLSLSHIRLHIPTNHRAHTVMTFNRILNYLAGAGVALFFIVSLFLFAIAGVILVLDFLFFLSVPMPDPALLQMQAQPTFVPANYYPPRF